jgi:hypothetical protein
MVLCVFTDNFEVIFPMRRRDLPDVVVPRYSNLSHTLALEFLYRW